MTPSKPRSRRLTWRWRHPGSKRRRRRWRRYTIRTVGNVGSIEDYTQPWGLIADLRIFRDRALGRQELKAIRRGVEATLPAAPAASDLVAPYDLTPGREYNAPPGPPGDY